MTEVFESNVAVVGAGHVGLTTAACLASLGHRVVCADVDVAKVDGLARGQTGIREPGLSELVADGLTTSRLKFVFGAAAAAPTADVVFLCVPTPMGTDGAADLTAVEAAVREIRGLLPSGCVVVNKSTVPVGTAARTAELLDRADVAVASNPEFLREGSAVEDFLNPDRIVIGARDPGAADRVAALYEGLGAPVLRTGWASAEITKYASNAYLATRLSFVNSIAELCERAGADIGDVTLGMGHDRRIGTSFLRPGPGWGGPCLPKDTHALLRSAEALGGEFPLLRAAIDTNARQRDLVVERVREAVGGRFAGVRVGLLGLTFKAGTDDVRDSPALAVAARMAAEGAELVAHDPAVPGPLPGALSDAPPGDRDRIRVVETAYAAADGAAALVVLTEWPEFRDLDWKRIAGLLLGESVIDTRNVLDASVLDEAGLSCRGVGRPAPRDPDLAARRPGGVVAG
ncbi:UDP-glucose/GDP-mannose dehydrogenase family protein [Actinomadura spongiicola]|uniref:UDP-glucose 6-dehydrogenase n=1 Tax=Actinomadura spongiicola TaxID=2303421 RepID=A0A372GAL2_9ACTN|nr:UDP-glucose/GDP-mannose dehydrogenase family protein [Actinomadura spongiicola]RFS82438.1 UDP-glucose/GDP-mannose dehydrogenase family protein [Actinomadura spongiicola]